MSPGITGVLLVEGQMVVGHRHRDLAHLSGLCLPCPLIPVPPRLSWVLASVPSWHPVSPLKHLLQNFSCSFYAVSPRGPGGCSDNSFTSLSSLESQFGRRVVCRGYHVSLSIYIFVWLFHSQFGFENLNLTFKDCHKLESSVRPAEK